MSNQDTWAAGLFNPGHKAAAAAAWNNNAGENGYHCVDQSSPDRTDRTGRPGLGLVTDAVGWGPDLARFAPGGSVHTVSSARATPPRSASGGGVDLQAAAAQAAAARGAADGGAAPADEPNFEGIDDGWEGIDDELDGSNFGELLNVDDLMKIGAGLAKKRKAAPGEAQGAAKAAKPAAKKKRKAAPGAAQGAAQAARVVAKDRVVKTFSFPDPVKLSGISFIMRKGQSESGTPCMVTADGSEATAKCAACAFSTKSTNLWFKHNGYRVTVPLALVEAYGKLITGASINGQLVRAHDGRRNSGIRVCEMFHALRHAVASDFVGGKIPLMGKRDKSIEAWLNRSTLME